MYFKLYLTLASQIYYNYQFNVVFLGTNLKLTGISAYLKWWLFLINPSALLLGLGCILATCSTFRTKILLESCKIHCWICKIEPVKERPCWLRYITYGSFCPNQCNRQRHHPCIHGSSSRSTRSCSCWTRGRWKS